MNLIEVLEKRVQENKNTTAYIYRNKRLSYEQMSKDIDAFAAALSTLGIKEGDRFAICLRNSPEFIMAWFALAKLGAIAVSINFLLGEDEMTYILEDSGAKGIVTQKEFSRKVREASSKTPASSLVILTDESPRSEKELFLKTLLDQNQGKPFPRPPVSEDKPVAILYTSGTTGKSKGAILTIGNLSTNAQAALAELDLKERQEVLLCVLPMFHIFAWTGLILTGLYLAAPVVIVESITPPKPWLKMMFKWKVTLFAAVPPVYHVLAKEVKGLKGLILKYFFFRSVRNCISGAAPLPLDTLLAFEKKMGKPILEGYGLTETSPVISINTHTAKKPATVGRVIAGVDVKIMDDRGQELSRGEEGEICVKGPNIFKGYFNKPEDTKATFTSNGYFKTGDIGKFDEEGFLKICDRIKDMISIKGLKVFPVQIEEIILKHPDVAETAVIGIPVEGGDEIIKAYVVVKKGKTINKADLNELLQKNLPPYKRPRDIEFRAELPKNALQKILKRELRKEAIEKYKSERPAQNHVAV